MRESPVYGLPESDREGRRDSEVTGDRQLSGEVIVYGSTLFLTFGTFCTWFLFRDTIEDVVYGGRLFSLLGEISLFWVFGCDVVEYRDVDFVGRCDGRDPVDCRLLLRESLATSARVLRPIRNGSPVRLDPLSTGHPPQSTVTPGRVPYDEMTLFSRVDEGTYVPGPDLYASMMGAIVVLGLATAVGLKAAFGDATWGVSTGLGACMAAGVFEVSRPQRISAEEKEILDAQFEDFVRFAEARLQRSGSCHESEIFRAFRTEVPGYRDKEALTDITLRLFVQQWAPGTDRTSNGFCKKLSLLPRVDPFRR